MEAGASIFVPVHFYHGCLRVRRDGGASNAPQPPIHESTAPTVTSTLGVSHALRFPERTVNLQISCPQLALDEGSNYSIPTHSVDSASKCINVSSYDTWSVLGIKAIHSTWYTSPYYVPLNHPTITVFKWSSALSQTSHCSAHNLIWETPL